jgi:hypothetical protein
MPLDLLLPASAMTLVILVVHHHVSAQVTCSRGILGGSLDLVFIDGAHDYESVSQDIQLTLHLGVSENGYTK